MFKTGDHIVSVSDIYGGTNRLLCEVEKRFGIGVTFVEGNDPQNFLRATNSTTKVTLINSIQ